MKVILSGGGDPPQSILTDKYYRNLILESSSRGGADILFVPDAVIPDWSINQAVEWLRRDTFEDLTVEIGYLAQIRQQPEPRSIFLMGGNTFRLLDAFLAWDTGPFLRRYANEGIVYGCSAGSIILGKSIRTAFLGQEPDANEVGLDRFEGLDLLCGLNIVPHFVEADLESVADLVDAELSGCLCIAEDGGALWDGSDLINIGASELLLCLPGSRQVIVPGSTISGSSLQP
jgi:peptidase E